MTWQQLYDPFNNRLLSTGSLCIAGVNAFFRPGGFEAVGFAVLASLSFAVAATPVAQDPVVRVTTDKLKWQSSVLNN